MRKGLNFRQKIILSHILLFFIFIFFAFLFIEKTVSRIVFNNVELHILAPLLPQVEEFTEQFKIWFFSFCALALFFFGSVTWLIFHRINDPIRQIIKAIKPYQNGQEEVIPHLELSKSMDEEDDFYTLAHTLNSLSDRLRLQIKNITDERNKVLEMGKDFAANASHELRTPITIIRGFAETLQDLPELPRDMVVDIIEKIVRNCQRMDTLVKNLLTLADLENLPDSRFKECDLVVLAETCRQVVLVVYETAQTTIEKNSESITIAADPDILELAIINLLDNAAKYSNPPAKITIKLEQEGDEACISISDQGIGIPPADLEHIFERFYTVDKARSRRLGGAGLGLSIVRTIVEKHHGTISVTSMVGIGTTFFIRLPIHRQLRGR
jgi:signal transduction histidine kinase